MDELEINADELGSLSFLSDVDKTRGIIPDEDDGEFWYGREFFDFFCQISVDFFCERSSGEDHEDCGMRGNTKCEKVYAKSRKKQE